MSVQNQLNSALEAMGLNTAAIASGDLDVFSPTDGSKLGTVMQDSAADTEAKIARSAAAFKQWRTVPAPRRGELIRLLGEELREHKEALGALVTLECGKIYQEGLGEVQEMIDICDFAVGLSRQLYGLTIASERPGHKMSEYWHPIGPVGIISAFNFPVAVWAWNAVLAIVCGDTYYLEALRKNPDYRYCMSTLAGDKPIARFGSRRAGRACPKSLSATPILASSW